MKTLSLALAALLATIPFAARADDPGPYVPETDPLVIRKLVAIDV